MDSILSSVKKVIGIAPEDSNFDADIILHINTILSVLYQLGVGPEKGFSISDDTAVWSDFLPDDPRLEMVKTYVALRVRLLFDPPANSALGTSLQNVVEELAWRLNLGVESEM